MMENRPENGNEAERRHGAPDEAPGRFPDETPPDAIARGAARARREQEIARDSSNRAIHRQIRVIGYAIWLPAIMVAGPVAGYYIGGWLGAWAGNPYWGRLIGLALGIAGAVQQVVSIIRRLLREMT